MVKSYFLPLLAVFLCCLSCDDDDDNNNVVEGADRLYDVVEGQENLSMFDQALQITGVDFSLQTQGSYTVFAPTDQAFNDYLSDNRAASLEDVPEDTLTSLVLNHILNVELTAEDLADGYQKTLANSPTDNNLDLYVNAPEENGAVLLNGESRVTETDFVVDNGVLHKIDRLLTLPTLRKLIEANESFTVFNDGLSQTGLADILDNVDENSDPAPPFTVFIPDDSAFEAVVEDDMSLNDTSDILALPNLNSILESHFITGANIRGEEFMDGDNFTNLTGEPLLINTSGGTVITDASGGMVNVVSVNITGVNGIAHIIDFILMPE